MAKLTDESEKHFRQDAARKTVHIPAPKKIGAALNNLMARKGYARVLAASALNDAWQAAAGERLGNHSRPGNVTRGVLEVVVRSSAVLQELTFVKAKILKQLLATCTGEKIRELKFKVGSID